MHPNRLGCQKASTCSRNKSQCHYQGLLSQSPLSSTFRESSLITSLFSLSLADLGELPLIRSGTLSQWVDQPLQVLTSLLIFFLLLLFNWTLGLCLYFHPSPDKGSMVISEIFISVTMGQDQFRHPLLCCQRT